MMLLDIKSVHLSRYRQPHTHVNKHLLLALPVPLMHTQTDSICSAHGSVTVGKSTDERSQMTELCHNNVQTQMERTHMHSADKHVRSRPASGYSLTASPCQRVNKVLFTVFLVSFIVSCCRFVCCITSFFLLTSET